MNIIEMTELQERNVNCGWCVTAGVGAGIGIIIIAT